MFYVINEINDRRIISAFPLFAHRTQYAAPCTAVANMTSAAIGITNQTYQADCTIQTIRQGSDNLRLPHLLIHASTDHTPRVQISLVNRPCHEAPPATFIICKDCLRIMAPPDSNETKYLLILAFVTSDELGYIKDSINAYKP